jgi:hypothetical protein
LTYKINLHAADYGIKKKEGLRLHVLHLEKGGIVGC